jgi:peptidoglycan/xylan/chitin deacetylase (PgdA/CDA1 family)
MREWTIALRWPATLAAALAMISGPPGTSAAAGGLAELQAACFAPAALAAIAGEEMPRRLAQSQWPRLPEYDRGQSAAGATAGVIRRVELPPGSRKLVALTFDFCEQPQEVAGYDGAIVDYLRANRVKATFFAGGKWMLSHSGRTQQLMTDPLFEIGTHGLAHRNTRLLSGPDLWREITAPSTAYQRVRGELAGAQCAIPHAAALASLPKGVRLFRFPFGSCNAAGLQAVAAAGLLAIQWDVSTGDPSPTQSARAIADALIRNVKPGSIVIAHANGRGHHTAAALPIAIPALRAKGFEFVTVGELLAAGRAVAADTCYDARPGDTDRYDALFARRIVPTSQATGEPRAAPFRPTLPR